MRQTRYIRIENRPPNILVRVAGTILGLVALGFAIIVGGLLLAGLIGIALIGGMALYARLWWLGRKAVRGDHEERIVEAEYQVIDTAEPNDQARDKYREPLE